jgi:dipeptidase D
MAKQNGLSSLEPKAVWQAFEDLTKVPRPSKKEEKILAFMKDWATKNNFTYVQDAVGNIVISKPATKGMENRTPIAIQGHVDMVCEKNSDVNFDFDTQAIEAYIDGDFVKAKGTTLGADNGIGVAMGMALMASTDIPHPALELLCTVDEETGLTGANQLQPGLMKAKIMLNLDSEEEDAFTIGCAGGINTFGVYEYEADEIPTESVAFEIGVKGLLGGHSGINIHEGRGNANVILTRILWKLTRKVNLRLSEFKAPGKHNAIPREAFATVFVKEVALKDFDEYIEDCRMNLRREFATKEPVLEVVVKKIDAPSKVMTHDFQKRFIDSFQVMPHGVFRMSPDIAGLVQTSTNFAVVETFDKEIKVLTSQRSSVESEKIVMASKVQTAMELGGAAVTSSDGYPAWEPDVNSSVLELGKNVYKKVFGKDVIISVIHAGLECGLVAEKYPGMDMLSFGPNLFDVHTPSEKVQISSVQKIWNFLVELVKNIPENKIA